jgi:hypothetical protein
MVKAPSPKQVMAGDPVPHRTARDSAAKTYRCRSASLILVTHGGWHFGQQLNRQWPYFTGMSALRRGGRGLAGGQGCASPVRSGDFDWELLPITCEIGPKSNAAAVHCWPKTALTASR